MKKTAFFCMLLAMFSLSACSKKETSDDEYRRPTGVVLAQEAASPLQAEMPASAQREPGESRAPSKAKESSRRYLAYEHSIGINIAEEKITPLVDNLKRICDAAESCDVLDISVSGNDFASAELKLRAKPADIPKLIALVSHEGKLSDQRTSAEDLSGRIEDTAKQIALKEDFRSRLEGLRAKAGSDIDALIKVNEQLVQVQSDLESLSGQRVVLMKRVDTEILNIRIASANKASVLAPLSRAASGFVRNSLDALAMVVTFIATALPWLLLLTFCVWLFKKIKHYRRRKFEKN